MELGRILTVKAIALPKLPVALEEFEMPSVKMERDLTNSGSDIGRSAHDGFFCWQSCIQI